MKKLTIFLGIFVFAFLNYAPVFADIYWTNWTSSTKGKPGSADGTIVVENSKAILVNYTGEVIFVQESGGTNYWLPTSTYTNSTISNAPPDSDIITLSGGNQIVNTISFSEPVVNPVMAIASLGTQNNYATYEFDSSFVILSFDEGYFGNGDLETVPFNILKGTEGNGTLQFIGTYSSISWTSSILEPFTWNGFTVGIPDGSSTINNSPNRPILSSPSNGSRNVSLRTTLRTNSFYDIDIGDTHLRTEWHISTSSDFQTSTLYKNSLVHLTSLPLPELLLEENKTYYWRVRFYDNNSYPSLWSKTFYFKTLTSQNDFDGNGIPDTLENNTVDLDDDGIPDLQQTDVKSLNTMVGDGQMGVSIKDSTTITSITGINSIDPDTVAEYAVPQNMPLGLFSFRISVENPGDTADVTIYFSEAADQNAKWYLHDSINGWVDYSAHATFSEDRKSVNLKLKDGDFGDADGVANGTIVDPSGFGIASWIKGFVSDASTSEKITTATISFADLGLNLKTLLDGNYLSMILPGTYDFSVSAQGYESQDFTDLEIAEAIIVTRDIELVSKIQINNMSVSIPFLQVNNPVIFSVDAKSDGNNPLYYRFSTRPDYGTAGYNDSKWYSMTSTEYTTNNSIGYTFTKAGKHIVVVWITDDPTNPKTDGIATIGLSVDIDGDTCKTDVIGTTISGTKETGNPISFSIDTQNSCSDTLYYRFSIRPNYGTVEYEGSEWESMTDTEWVSSKTVNHTFTKSGNYLVVVWASDDPNNYDPNGIPIVGWSIAIE